MKLTVQTFLTLDGVMQSPGKPDEDPSDDFAHGGWQAPFPDPTVGEFVTELNSHASAFLFGRRTFDIFRDYWPDHTDPANVSLRRSTPFPNTSCPARSTRPQRRGAERTPTLRISCPATSSLPCGH